jgi:hypothetical protein
MDAPDSDHPSNDIPPPPIPPSSEKNNHDREESSLPPPPKEPAVPAGPEDTPAEEDRESLNPSPETDATAVDVEEPKMEILLQVHAETESNQSPEPFGSQDVDTGPSSLQKDECAMHASLPAPIDTAPRLDVNSSSQDLKKSNAKSTQVMYPPSMQSSRKAREFTNKVGYNWNSNSQQESPDAVEMSRRETVSSGRYSAPRHIPMGIKKTTKFEKSTISLHSLPEDSNRDEREEKLEIGTDENSDGGSNVAVCRQASKEIVQGKQRYKRVKSLHTMYTVAEMAEYMQTSEVIGKLKHDIEDPSIERDNSVGCGSVSDDKDPPAVKKEFNKDVLTSPPRPPPVFYLWTYITEEIFHAAIRRFIVVLSSYASRNPYRVIVSIVLLAFSLAGVGFMTNFKAVFDHEILFTPTNSLPAKHGEWIYNEAGFEDSSDVSLLIHADGENILHIDAMRRTFEALDTLRNTTGYEELCATSSYINLKGSHDCWIWSSTQFWGHDIDKFNAEVTSDYDLIEILSRDTYPDGTPVYKVSPAMAIQYLSTRSFSPLAEF